MEVLSICVSDIPKSEIKKADNGKLYMNIVVQKMKKVDNYDNDLTVYMSQTKEERAAKVEKCYIGKGRTYEFTEGTSQQPTQEEIESAPAVSEDDSGLPF